MLAAIQHSPAFLVLLHYLSLGHAQQMMLYKIDKESQMVLAINRTVTKNEAVADNSQFILDGKDDISPDCYKIGNREHILPGIYKQPIISSKEKAREQIILQVEVPELDIHEGLLRIFFETSIADERNRVGFVSIYTESGKNFVGLAVARREGENSNRQFTTKLANSEFHPSECQFTFYYRCRKSVQYAKNDEIQLMENEAGVWCFEDFTIQLDVFQYYHKLRRMDRTKNYRASFNPALPNQIKLSELDLTGSEDYDILISLDGIVLEKYSIANKYKIDESLSSCILEKKANSGLPETNVEEVLVSFFKPGTPPTLQSRVVGNLTMETITIAENSIDTRECVKLTDEPLKEHYYVLTKMSERIDYNPSEAEELSQFVNDQTLWFTKPRYTPVEATLYDFWGMPFGTERNEIIGYNAIALGSSKTRNSCVMSVPRGSAAVELEEWLGDEICYFKVANKQFAGVGEKRECYFVRCSHIGFLPDRCHLYFYEVQLRPNEWFLIFKAANLTWTTTFNYDSATTTPTFSVKIFPPRPVLRRLEAGPGKPNLIKFSLSVPSNSSPDGYTTKELTFIKYAKNEVVLSKQVEKSVTFKTTVEAQPQPQSSLQLGPNPALSHIIPFQRKKSQSLVIPRDATNPNMLRQNRPKSVEVHSEEASPELSVGPIFNTKKAPIATLVVVVDGTEVQFSLQVQGPRLYAWWGFGMTLYTTFSKNLPAVQTMRDENFTVIETPTSGAHFVTFRPNENSVAHMFVKTPARELGYTVHGIGPTHEILLGRIIVTLWEHSILYDSKEYELTSAFTGNPAERFIVTSVTNDHSFFDDVSYNVNRKRFISNGCIRWFSEIRQETFIHVYRSLDKQITKFFLTLVVTDQRIVLKGTTECHSYTVESMEDTWLERYKNVLGFVVVQCNIPRQFSEYKAEDIMELKSMNTAEKILTLKSAKVFRKTN